MFSSNSYEKWMALATTTNNLSRAISFKVPNEYFICALIIRNYNVNIWNMQLLCLKSTNLKYKT